jgi:hypothetical protein
VSIGAELVVVGDGYRQRAVAIKADAVALVVIDESTKASATELLAGIARLKAEAENTRAVLVKPLNDQVKGINETFRSVLAPVLEADQLLRERVLAYNRDQQRRAEEAAAAAERERLASQALLTEAEKAEAAGQGQVAEQLLERAVEGETAARAVQREAVLPSRHVNTGIGSSTVAKRWTFELEDLGKVPVAYLALDETKVRKAIASGVREIPGVRIFQAETLAVRR